MLEFAVDPISIDVGHLVRRNLASLYSSLVTRPTGQAVRMAIENVLSEEGGELCLSVIDLSRVTVMDFSCADEVVAKLLLRFLENDRPRNVFFVFRGVRDLHRGPMEVVLERQSLAAVCETGSGAFHLIGAASTEEAELWGILERRRRIDPSEVARLNKTGDPREALEGLVSRRLAFRNPLTGGYHALSDLLGDRA